MKLSEWISGAQMVMETLGDREIVMTGAPSDDDLVSTLGVVGVEWIAEPNFEPVRVEIKTCA